MGNTTPRAPAASSSSQQLGAGAVVAVGIVGAEVGVGVEELDPGNLLARALEQGEELSGGWHGRAGYPSGARGRGLRLLASRS